MTERTTAFANARIFDGVSDELREGCVRVVAGTTAEIAEGPGPGDRIVDCRGRTIVPGLIDAHFHAYAARLSLLEIETSPLSYLALAGARRLAGALGRGFTTVRDPGGGDAGLAQAIREGLTAAPRYLFCGAALSQTGGHGDPRPPELGCCLGGCPARVSRRGGAGSPRPGGRSPVSILLITSCETWTSAGRSRIQR